MSTTRVDARGLSCPQPVILTQKAIDGGAGFLEVLVSTTVSKENVTRCASRNGMKAEAREEGGDFILLLSR